jgi:two-component system, NtrC family, response regulator AtoC
MIVDAIERARLIVVSRDPVVLCTVGVIAAANYWQLEIAANLLEAMEHLQSGVMPDLILLDVPRGEADDLHILRWLHQFRPALPTLLIGDSDKAGKKQTQNRLGAGAYLSKPIDESELEAVIRHLVFTESGGIEADTSNHDIEVISDGVFFIGTSLVMRKLRAQAALLAEVDVPILILGEGGSGKETTARLVHKLSVRSQFEFGKVNCAALPGDRLERELFGSLREGSRAFASANPGKLEACAKGTILLDEITEMPLRVQANLMQVVRNKRFIRPGTATSVEVDVRVLAACTTNTENAISKNRLRDDLYEQLSSYTVRVPPLRERKEEMPLLLRHLMRQVSDDYGLPPRSFSTAGVEACHVYSWPGNLRELEKFVRRYLLSGDEQLWFDENRSDLYEAAQVGVSSALQRASASSKPRSHAGAGDADSLRSMVKTVKLETERTAISAALEKTGWNRKAAARLLKVSYRTLLYKIDQYQIRSPDSSDT